MISAQGRSGLSQRKTGFHPVSSTGQAFLRVLRGTIVISAMLNRAHNQAVMQAVMDGTDVLAL